MTYNAKTWRDLPNQTTPIVASELNRIETGIDQAHDAIDLLNLNRAAVVVVLDGSESRPSGSPIVFWVGGQTRPENMGETDLWFTTPATALVPPSIITASLNTMTQTLPFSQTLLIEGSPTITVAVTSGTLPSGISLSSAGVLSGTWHVNSDPEQNVSRDNLQLYNNPGITELVFDQPFTQAWSVINAAGCSLTEVDLTGCDGLSDLNLSSNPLSQEAVDDILVWMDETWSGGGGTINLLDTYVPSPTGQEASDSLSLKGWTVLVDEPF